MALEVLEPDKNRKKILIGTFYLHTKEVKYNKYLLTIFKFL